MKLWLFAFVFLFFVLIFSSCGRGPQTEARTSGSCIHPAVLGGAPFEVPGNAYFTGNGHLVIPQDGDKELTLVGAFCVLKRGGE